MYILFLIFITIIANTAIGWFYLRLKKAGYTYLLSKKVFLYREKELLYTEVLSLIILFPLQFMDMTINGYDIPCYLNRSVRKKPALPFTPNWLPGLDVRCELTYKHSFTKSHELDELNYQAHLDTDEQWEQMMFQKHERIATLTLLFGIFSILMHVLFVLVCLGTLVLAFATLIVLIILLVLGEILSMLAVPVIPKRESRSEKYL